MITQVFSYDGDYKDYESITVANTSTAFTANKVKTNAVPTEYARVAFCRLETAQIRYWLDGIDPTSSEGILLQVGETLIIHGYTNIDRFRAVRTGSASGVLRVHYGY